jgi:hypothetical protein
METTREETYCKYLKEEGFPTTHIDEDGDVIFKAEGLVYFIRNGHDFPERFALVLPSFFELEDAAEASRALAVCNEVNKRVHGATLYIVEFEGRKEVSAAVELFLRTPVEDVPAVFYHCLKAIRAAVYGFVTRMQAAQVARPLPVESATISAGAGNAGDSGGGYL